MSSLSTTFRSLAVAAFAVFASSCADSPTGPRSGTPVGTIRLSDTLFTRSAVIRAGIDVPAGYALRSGSVRWTVASGTATVSEVAGASDSVDVSLTATGGVTLRATYTLTSAGAASSISLAGPSTRVAGDVALETARSITVAAPRLEYTVLPTASITAGTTLGGVRVDILDAAGRLMSNATDSVNIALDPTSGTAGATLFGTTGARAVAGRATFANLSLQRSGTGYRLIASSPTITVRDTATTAVVAAAPSAATTTLTVADSLRSVSQTTTVTVTVRDQYGNLVLNATPSSIGGSASIGTLGAFTCANGICTATYTASTVGTATIGATIGGTPVSGSPKTVQVTPGPAVRLVITGDSTQTAGGTQNITITAYDAFGNVATGYTGTKDLTFSGASVAPNGTTQPTITSTNFTSATGITFVNGVATGIPMTLYKVETATISVTDGTLSTSGTDRLPVTVTAATPSPTTTGGGSGASGVTSSITVSRDTLEVGDSLTVTVRLFDAYGNPILNATASSFATAVSGGTLGSFSCTNGVCTARWAAPTTPGAQTIGATIGGTAVGGSPATVQVVTGPADPATSTIAVQDSVTTQGSTTTVRITLRDRYGNPVTTGTPTVGGSTTQGTLGAFTCTNGVCSATYTGTTLGTATITGTIGGTPIPTTTSVRVTAGAAARLVITGDSTQVAGTTQDITITAYDANGNVATSYTGTKSLTFSGASAAPSGVKPTVNATDVGTAVNVTFVNGVATLVPMKLVKVETAVIATTDGTIVASGTDRLTVVVRAAAPNAAQSALTLSRTTVAVGDTLTATVTVKDEFGNPVNTAAATDFVKSSTAGTLGTFSCTNNVCTATYTAPTTPGTPTISATIGGTAITGAPATVTVVAGPAAKLVITGDSTQVAGAAQTITITAYDAYGNVATGYTGAKSLTFSGASVSPNLNAPTVGGTAFGAATSITFTNGVATASMTLVAAGTAVVATTDGTITASGTDRLTVRVTADNASPVVSDLQASPASITADGVTTSVLTLQLKDANGNPTTNVASPGTVEIVQTAGTGTLVADFTNIGGGSYTQTVTSDAAAGSGTFKVRLNGTIGSQQAVVTYVAAGGPLDRVVCTTSQPAGQNAASNTTVTLCAATQPGDLEIVTLALDGVDDIVAPTGATDGTWTKISSTLQTTGSGGNKPMLLVLYARRYEVGNARTVTFTAGTQHKWSVDMITFRSSGNDVPGVADIAVSQSSDGTGLSSPGLTAPDANTVVYYVMANSLTGNTATPTPNGLTVLGNNNTGGTSSASFMELLVNAGDVAPSRTWVNTKTANTVLIQIKVHP